MTAGEEARRQDQVPQGIGDAGIDPTGGRVARAEHDARDGEDLAGHAKAAAEKAKTKGVVVFTVGLGDPKGAKIPGVSKGDPYLSYQGKEVISRLQHETLKEIADITGEGAKIARVIRETLELKRTLLRGRGHGPDLLGV